MSPLDKELPVPLYHQLKCALITAIESGEWQSGQQLPNEGKLAETFGVSKVTVRQALRDLSDVGYVRREQGRGTFVSRPKLGQGPRELSSFSEEMRRHHLTASSRILERFETGATERVSEALQIPFGEQVFVLKRLRLADAEPMAVQTAHIPVKLVPGLVEADLENASLYELLHSRYRLQPFSARETYSAIPVDLMRSELLRVPPGAPVLAVERVTYLATGKPFEFVQSLIRGDRYSIILELEANRFPQTIRRGGTQ
ncbi:MAG TPA: GntR family transcriptional regulator [Bryobacteraceae bacterium]|jgi:GntR family transcriptional regulator|nr:GntR family transcriptional regulator [Bryobacteraceae bacterium]